MARDWYVRQGTAVYGPYPSARVQALAREGRITPDAELSTGPAGPWHRATAVRWLVLPFGRAVWRYLIVRTTRYELTSQRLRTTRGIISRHVEELELYRVKDTAFSQSVFERVFGLATVRITSSDHSTPITTIDSVPAPIAQWVREAIRGCVEELRTRKQVREVDYSTEP
jgi:uncharacterized membrane protein YdbT with pleckstrin-like domain